MRARAKVVWLMSALLTIAAMALPVGSAFAQGNDRIPMAFMGGFLMFVLLFAAAGYVYMALALQTIAQKTNTNDAWLAWIPIVNIVLMLNIGKKPIWWIVLFFIPIVNIVMVILVWMAVAEARSKPGWWGILTIVPLVNLIVPGYLAWSD